MTRASARVGSIRIDGIWRSLDEVTRLVRIGLAAEARTQPTLPLATRPQSPLATVDDVRRARRAIPQRPVRRGP